MRDPADRKSVSFASEIRALEIHEMSATPQLRKKSRRYKHLRLVPGPNARISLEPDQLPANTSSTMTTHVTSEEPAEFTVPR